MTIEQRNGFIGIFLTLVILALTYVLYDSIVTPYREVMAKQEEAAQVRERMQSIRDALIAYQRAKETFPKELSELVTFLRSDPSQANRPDSLYTGPLNPPPLDLDTFILSPRNGKPFEYALNDTLRPMVYLLKDPDSEDRIGSLERTTLLNASSWD